MYIIIMYLHFQNTVPEHIVKDVSKGHVEDVCEDHAKDVNEDYKYTQELPKKKLKVNLVSFRSFAFPLVKDRLTDTFCLLIIT